MGELKDRYRSELRAIALPKGSAEREAARQELYRQYQADSFRQEGGAPHTVHWAQRMFAVEYYKLVASFYNGELLDDAAYRRQRVRVLRRYAQRLRHRGLLTGVFDDAWIDGFARDSLQLERGLLPVPRVFTGWTEEDAQLLCDPLRSFSKRFFRAVHAEFGVPRLKKDQETYGGVDADLYVEELSR